MRSLELSRDEAEVMVDVLEGSGIPAMAEVAAEIRRLFGMVTREREAEAKAEQVPPPGSQS